MTSKPVLGFSTNNTRDTSKRLSALKTSRFDVVLASGLLWFWSGPPTHQNIFITPLASSAQCQQQHSAIYSSRGAVWRHDDKCVSVWVGDAREAARTVELIIPRTLGGWHMPHGICQGITPQTYCLYTITETVVFYYYYYKMYVDGGGAYSDICEWFTQQ